MTALSFRNYSNIAASFIKLIWWAAPLSLLVLAPATCASRLMHPPHKIASSLTSPLDAAGSSSSKDGSKIKGVKITPPSDVAATTYYNSGSVTAPVRTKDPWGTYDSAVHEMQDGTLGGGRGGINYVDGAGGDWSAPSGYSKYVWNFSGSASSAIPLDPDVSGLSTPTLPVTGSAEQGYEWDIAPAQTYCGSPFTATASVSVTGPNATASGTCTIRYHAPFEVPTLVSGPTYSQKWYLKPFSCSPAVGGTISSTQRQQFVSITPSTTQEYVTFQATIDQWNFAVHQTELWNSTKGAQGNLMILKSTPALFTGPPSEEMGKCSWVPCLAIMSYYTSYAVNDYSSDGYDGESTYTVRTPDEIGTECIFTEKI